MRKYITLFFLGSLLLLSCDSNKPAGKILSHDQMVGLLTDIHIVDGRMYTVSQSQDSMFKYATGRYLRVFKLHHTDSSNFRKSMNYYALNPTDLNDIYDQVLTNLKKKTDSLNKSTQNINHGAPIK